MCQKNKEVIVVIPCYHEELNDLEKISLDQCLKILSDYEICFILPQSVYNRENILFQKYKYIVFEDKFFESVETYNRMMLDINFYEKFLDYKYMLVYQLDAFVFRDELSEFCKMGYDYIGAPWYEGLWYIDEWDIDGDAKEIYVGNGGLSLRNIAHCIEVLKRRKISKYVIEDVFFSSSDGNDFRVAPMEVAAKFSVEHQVKKALEMNENNTPFGAHQWNRFDAKRLYPFIQEAGYEVEFENGELDKYMAVHGVDKRYLKDANREMILRGIFFLMREEREWNIYIYGIGIRGRECAWLMCHNGIAIEGFLDNYVDVNITWNEYGIVDERTVQQDENGCLILTVKKEHDSILKQLREKFISVISYNELIEFLMKN